MAEVVPIRKASVALIGSDTLLGREVRDVASESKLPARLHLIAADVDEAGTLTEQEGEATFVAPLGPDTLEGAQLVILAGSPESSRAVLSWSASAQFIDLTYVGEERPSARLRAPLAEPENAPPPAGTVHAVAHPAAIALAMVLRRLAEQHPIVRSVVHVFEPASERGRKGLDELQNQTVSLLTFKGQPKVVFGEQLAFNLLARYGDDAPQALAESELRIERHLASLLGKHSKAPMPSLRLIQASVFHGYSFSLWVEFEHNPGPAGVERAMHTGGSIDVREGEAEPPNVVGFAGQMGVAVGAVAADRNCSRACWIWAVTDNLRLMAENAVAVARQLL